MNATEAVLSLVRGDLPLPQVLRPTRHARAWQAGAVATLLLVGFLGARGWSKNPTYREAQARRGRLVGHVLVTGRVQPDNRINVQAPIGGRAERVLVREGDKVVAGQVLAWMSSNERAAILDSARVMGPKELEHWKKTSSDTPVMASSAGTIIQRNIEPGQSFGDKDAIFVMSDRLVIEAPIDETDLARVEVGQKAEIVLDPFPEQKLPSKVLRISHEGKPENNVITYKMELAPDQVPDTTRAGMTANVRFELEPKEDTILIPSEAVKATEKDFYVLIRSSGDEPERRFVQRGASDGATTEIISGLKEGETVLIPSPAMEKARRERAVF